MVSQNILIGLLAIAAVHGAALPQKEAQEPACASVAQRRAWHTLTNDEKRSYIDAELCLMNKGATLGLLGAKNKFEELQSVHQLQSAIAHGVGAFLPFHRLLMHAHEVLLQTECGYEGTQPYWDETHDVGQVTTSDILDPETGFGGDGVGEEGCIDDGPFAEYVNSLGPGYQITDHCIYRFVNDTISLQAGQEYIDACYKRTEFIDFWPCIEGPVHNSGHGSIGGLMLDPIASPGDPLFYLHHTFLDKVFWDWQALDLPARLTDMGGRNVQRRFGGFPGGPGGDDGDGDGPPSFPPPGDDDDFEFPEFPGFPGSSEFPDDPPAIMPPFGSFPDFGTPPPQVPSGDPGDETTLGHILDMFGIIPNATIAEVMDIAGGVLCYEYV